LKLKSGEIMAISALESGIKQKITPFFDFPKQDEMPEADFINKAVRKLRSFRRHLNMLTSFYMDNFDIDSSLKINGKDNYSYLLDLFAEFPLIPVVSIDRTASHIKAVIQAKNSKTVTSNVIALRLIQEDFENFDVVVDEIEDMLGPAFQLFEEIDLVFDCRVCNNSDFNKISDCISQFATKFSAQYPVRKIIITGSSIPPSIRDLAQTESESEIRRSELVVFHKIVSRIGDEYQLVLGDYTTVSPNYSDLKIRPEAMQNVTAPKIIYSFKQKQYIIRGGALRTHSRGLAQYQDLSKILANKAFFRGGNYSFGDRYLVEKCNGIGSQATPSTIVKPLINAHLTFMFNNY
ncbi:MAG: hypothetical protein HOK67_13315, partial [Deltaproteobacteria bacterium]|nr:hypothetical protein [Deltaproteobacteria bacterium]